jgi:hypothetical protein
MVKNSCNLPITLLYKVDFLTAQTNLLIDSDEMSVKMPVIRFDASSQIECYNPPENEGKFSLFR